MTNPKAIDLFAGAGGMSKGLSEAGFDIVKAVDGNEHCGETYRKNHEGEFTCADVREIEPEDIGVEKGEIDLVAGGPPCPTFSKVGRSKINSLDGRNNVDDDRHELYEDFLRFVDILEPEYFLMENVPGMLSATNSAGENVAQVIESQMESLGYEVKHFRLNAANFGVPQKRERLFFVGSRNNGVPDLQRWESHTEPQTQRERKMNYRNLSSRDSHQTTLSSVSTTESNGFPDFKKDRSKEPWNTVGDAILDLPPVSPKGEQPPKLVEKYTVPALSKYQKWARETENDEDWKNLKLHNHEARGHNLRDLTLYKILSNSTSDSIGDLPDDIQPFRDDIFDDKIKKQVSDRPASTIVAHIAKDGHMFVHPTEARSLTVREAARLQSFRDSFIFPVSRTQAYRQIGNAVPPLLAQGIGTALLYEMD